LPSSLQTARRITSSLRDSSFIGPPPFHYS
jgi:hypothetical protein